MLIFFLFSDAFLCCYIWLFPLYNSIMTSLFSFNLYSSFSFLDHFSLSISYTRLYFFYFLPFFSMYIRLLFICDLIFFTFFSFCFCTHFFSFFNFFYFNFSCFTVSLPHFISCSVLFCFNFLLFSSMLFLISYWFSFA